MVNKKGAPPETFWNYRYILAEDSNGHPYYSVRGVYYADYGKVIEGWDADEARLTFDQGDSISGFLSNIVEAGTKPLLYLVDGDSLIEFSESPAELIVAQQGLFPEITSTKD